MIHPRGGINPQVSGRPLLGQPIDQTPQKTFKQPVKNQRGRGTNRSSQRGRGQGYQNHNQQDIQYDTQPNGTYAVNTYNRFDPLLGQGTRDNMNNGPTPHPVSFLGKGKRGVGRGRGRGNRPWRGRPQQQYNHNTSQEWWNPPQWQEYRSPARHSEIQHGEGVEQAEGSTRKRPRQTE